MLSGATDIDSPERVVLIGPSGSGKSHLGRLLAQATGRTLVDIDTEIERRIGMSISEFFERFGESAFRTLETEALIEACSAPGRVIATGGGAVIAPGNWAAMRPGSVILGLTATVGTLVERVRRQAEAEGRTAERPNMAGDAVERMQTMLEQRERFYAQADVVIDTEDLSIEATLDAAKRAVDERSRVGLIPYLSIDSPIERSDLYVHRGIRRSLGELIGRRWPSASRAWIITDDRVAAHWLDETVAGVQASGMASRTIVVPAGESSKSMQRLGAMLDEMTSGGVTRSDVVIALGGGVVGDLAGFAAAVCLRGLSLVQLPTSLLAMVDSSVGGKTAVNSAAGKNMVGAFYQPGMVLIDTDYLSTLPAEEYRSGMAEVIKHGVIQPSTPLASSDLATLLENLSGLDPIEGELIDEVVKQNVLTKYSVVQADERESGLRMVLNFGHTAGHAIEADGYRYRHGEAVGLGMLVATHIAIALDFCSGDRYLELEGALERAGLPTRYSGDIGGVIENLKSDKKNIGGVQRWILPVGGSGVETRHGIEADVVAAAIAAIGGS